MGLKYGFNTHAEKKKRETEWTRGLQDLNYIIQVYNIIIIKGGIIRKEREKPQIWKLGFWRESRVFWRKVALAKGRLSLGGPFDKSMQMI